MNNFSCLGSNPETNFLSSAMIGTRTGRVLTNYTTFSGVSFCIFSLVADETVKEVIRRADGLDPAVPASQPICKYPERLFSVNHRSPASDLCSTPLGVEPVLKLALFGFVFSLSRRAHISITP